MGDKKHIDRLFQEHFKDFEATPDNDMWNRIQDELGHKKKRRVIPFWMQLGGIAAAIALLFMLGYNLFSSEENQNKEPQIVNEDVKKDASPTIIENENSSANEVQQNKINIEDAIVDENDNTSTDDEIEVAVAKSNNANNQTEKDRNSNLTNKKTKTNAVAVQNKIEGNASTKKTSLKDQNIQLTKNEGVAANNDSPVIETSIISKDNSYQKDANELINADTKNTIAVADKKEDGGKDKAAQKGIINKDIELKSSTAIASSDAKEKEKVKEENSLPSILDAINQEEKDTDIAKIESPNNRKWSVNPMIAPVYYNTAGEGSPIHSQFKDNAKSGDINLSYGVGVAYQVSKRLSVRSGVNVVNLGYETEEIAFTASLDGGNLETISYNSNTSRLDVKDRTPSGSSFGELSSDVPNDVNLNTNRGPTETLGVMSQQFGYVEVPVELKYRLVDKKLGINVIGGLSSLFLTDNSISLESDNLITNVGEANNVNNMSFTTNIGIGIDYALSNNLQLNLEPIFKYQLNAFNREAGDFRPFYMGVYTGISFKF